MHCYIAPDKSLQDYKYISIFNFSILYSIIGYLCKKTVDTYYKNIELSKQSLKEYPADIIKSVDISHDDEYKQTLLSNLLSINSLDRVYILYFIFKRKGNFTNIHNIDIEKQTQTQTHKQTQKQYNSYILYKTFLEHYNLLQNDVNLDETVDPDISITINNIKYELTLEKLYFIQWVYYTGLYDYLINNEELKYEILNEMYELNLLSGNIFLRYQLFLCEYEYKYSISEKSNTDTSTDTGTDTDNTDTDNTDIDETYETDETYDTTVIDNNEKTDEKTDDKNINNIFNYITKTIV